MIANILDYDPDVQSYRDEVNRIVNENYRNWFVSRPYSFSQKTIDIFTMPDASVENATITSSTSEVRNWIQSSTLDRDDAEYIGFVYRNRLTHEGSILIVSSAEDSTNNGTYVVDKIDFGDNRVYVSKMSSTPQVDWESATLDSITASVNQRYLTLPADVAQILSVGIRNLDEGDGASGTNALGHIYNLTRRRDEELNLRYDLTGTPTEYIVYDSYPENTIDIDQFVPRAGKDFEVEEVANATGWPQGKYQFKMSYVWRGVEGQLSDPYSFEITASGKIPRFKTFDTTKQGFKGLRKKFYIRLQSITGKDGGTYEESFYRDLSNALGKPTPNTGASQYFYLLIDDDEVQVDWPQAITALSVDSIDDLFRFPRAEINVGSRKRLRLYPRPASITPVEFRYVYMPVLLEDDYDKPKCPDDTHRYLVYQSCADLFMKHNNPDMAAFYEKKAEKELMKIDNKYLTERSAYFIKKAFISGPLRVKPFQRLTKLPDA